MSYPSAKTMMCFYLWPGKGLVEEEKYYSTAHNIRKSVNKVHGCSTVSNDHVWKRAGDPGKIWKNLWGWIQFRMMLYIKAVWINAVYLLQQQKQQKIEGWLPCSHPWLPLCAIIHVVSCHFFSWQHYCQPGGETIWVFLLKCYIILSA